MGNIRAQALLAAVCLMLGILLAMQFNSQRPKQQINAPSTGDQATYISDLYRVNEDLRTALEQLQSETAKYQTDDSQGNSKLVEMINDLHRLRMANGAVEVTGPGVTVIVSGTVSLSTLQDVVNELRNAGAEGIAINGVRLVTRSLIGEDATGVKQVDGQALALPYQLDAIGDSHTLAAALQRKGGLISQIMESLGSKIEFKVEERGDPDNQITLPKSNADPEWHYARPVAPGQ
jgi:uncharacterized protein YlxW (UPF0749 family)